MDPGLSPPGLWPQTVLAVLYSSVSRTLTIGPFSEAQNTPVLCCTLYISLQILLGDPAAWHAANGAMYFCPGVPAILVAFSRNSSPVSQSVEARSGNRGRKIAVS